MKRVLISVVALAVIAVFASDASAITAHRTVAKPAPQIRSWSIEITTQGGIAGHGTGGITVASDGSIGISFINDSAPRCTFQLHATALEEVSRLVVNATPKYWVESYLPAHLGARCCDMITTTMRLTRMEDDKQVIYETRWLNAGALLPTDLSDLIAAVAVGDTSIRTRFTPLCTKKP
jgi:hypothetical protein